MSKIKITKRGISALALATIVTLSSGCSKQQKNDSDNQVQIYSGTTKYKENDILGNDEFIIIDVGSYKTINKTKSEEILGKCNDKDYSLGIVINSKATTLAEIYEDVEYAKKLVSEHTINYPLYIDVDKIMENDSIEVDKKIELINAFLEKCDANNIYMGIKGKDENLCALSQIMDLSTYDVYVVAKDKDNVKYTGVISIVEDRKGKVESKIQYRDIIEGKYNDPEDFKYDLYEIISEDNTIEKISRRHDISVEDLLAFGDIKLRTARKENTIVRVPNKVLDENPSKINISYDRLKTPLLGFDMSIAQKENVAMWPVLSSTFDYAILRAYDGSSKDQAFEEYYKSSQDNNMNIGAYAYNGVTIKDVRSHNEFEQLQFQQANKVINILKDKNIKFPVYLSLDQITEENFDKESIETMIRVWKETMSDNGYIPGIYCNSFSYENMKKIAGEEVCEGLEMWLAGGDQFTGGRKNCKLENITEPSSKTKYGNIPMFQCSDCVIGAGAGNRNGHLDVNMSYIDYANPIKTQTVSEDFVSQNLGIKSCDETKENCKKNAKKVLIGIGGVTTGGFALVLAREIAKSRRKGKYLREKIKAKDKRLEKRI